MSKISPIPTAVSQAFEAFPSEHRATLLAVRELIFKVAGASQDIGPLEETLRWGEPAYITTKKRTGSTIRLAMEKASGRPALFFNCQTKLVDEFREKIGPELTYVKNRAILLDKDLLAKPEVLAICIESALRYHLRKQS